MMLQKKQEILMKISTAEIKLLLKECVRSEGVYTISDFSRYISLKSDKAFTKSQVSGAISQLVDTGMIARVERGLYKGPTQEMGEESKEKKGKIKTRFAQEAIDFLDEIENKFADFVNSKEIWKLDEHEFEILSEMRELKERMEKICKKCEYT